MSDALIERFRVTRQQSIDFCEYLAIEDYCLQAAAFASPPKWHLAHTTWFYETFILSPFVTNYRPVNPAYAILFNSYYNGVGKQFPRPQRGLLSRPTLEEVIDYRSRIDAAMETLLHDQHHPQRDTILFRCTLGIAHEQQHQELFFTDIKYSLSVNPLFPTFSMLEESPPSVETAKLQWIAYEGGLVEIGFNGGDENRTFAFDNELPRHKTYLEPFCLSNRLITNGEYQEFIDDGGYQHSELWLADGWVDIQTRSQTAPLYWHNIDGQPMEFTLHGMQRRCDTTPVCHVSGYEADAFARWSNARLPSEAEWEIAASEIPVTCSGVDNAIYHPQPAFSATQSTQLHRQAMDSEVRDNNEITQLYGECWQWTQTAYAPYPGYQPAKGAIGEYNGKFMANQWVLRGGSCVSKHEHLRPSYRNFFYPHDRWQFSGIRLAK